MNSPEYRSYVGSLFPTAQGMDCLLMLGGVKDLGVDPEYCPGPDCSIGLEFLGQRKSGR